MSGKEMKYLVDANSIILTLISRNTKDFEDISGLTCINPYDLK